MSISIGVASFAAIGHLSLMHHARKKFVWVLQSIVLSCLLAATSFLLLGCEGGRPRQLTVEHPATTTKLKLVAQIPLSRARSALRVGRLIFVARNFDGMSLIDITQAESPQLVATIKPMDLQPLDLAASSDSKHVFVADRFRGLVTLDISRPAMLTTCSVLKLAGIPTELYPFSTKGRHFLAVAAGEGGIQIVDVSNPTHPNIVTSFTLGTDYATGIRVYENSLVLANNDDGGMELFALSEEARLQPLYRVNTVGYCVAVDVQPPLIAAALRTGGVALYSTSAFTQGPSLRADPVPTVQFLSRISKFPDYVQKAVITKSFKLVVANNESGIQLYDVSDPRRPWLEDSLDLVGEVVNVLVDDDWIYACAWDGGLALVRMVEEPAKDEIRDGQMEVRR